MRRHVTKSALAFALVGLGATAPQTSSGGSAVPCAVPLAWRLARLDDEFGLGAAEATAALQRAAAVWEERVGHPLFRHDPRDGFPIRLVYDERQARADERTSREAELSGARAGLDAAGEQLVQQGDRHAAARTLFAERQRAYERRLQEHNADVRTWNEQGGAPEDVAERLDQASQALRRERGALEQDGLALEAQLRALQDEVGRLNRANEAHALRAEALATEFPSGTMEAGEYREAVRTENRRVVAVGREIRVYRFSHAHELTLIVAHELGHALGLGHADDPDAVMSAEHDSRVEGLAVTAVHAADLALLRATCPALSGEAR
ncbi:MAG TPA: matrixin family metalloprotease [Longimicrobiales bacterium]|nr:matrixin family metalloprotease [Longimicrobiales bacterium]